MTLEGVAVDIEVRGVTKWYGWTRALDDVTFTARHGAVTGLVGPAGAGKSTLLRVLVGLVRADGGATAFGGTSYTRLRRPQRSVGAVLGTPLPPGGTVRDLLRARAAAAGLPLGRADEVAEELDLTARARRPVGRCSSLTRYRLELAAALLADPEVLVVDEPAESIAPEDGDLVTALLRRCGAGGRTVLVALAGLGSCAGLVDDLVELRDGQATAARPLVEALPRPGLTPRRDRLVALGSPA